MGCIFISNTIIKSTVFHSIRFARTHGARRLASSSEDELQQKWLDHNGFDLGFHRVSYRMYS